MRLSWDGNGIHGAWFGHQKRRVMMRHVWYDRRRITFECEAYGDMREIGTWYDTGREGIAMALRSGVSIAYSAEEASG